MLSHSHVHAQRAIGRYLPENARACTNIMDTLSRHRTVHFYHQYLRGVSHYDTVQSLKEKVEIDKITSIQLTANTCVITCSDMVITQHTIFTDGINIHMLQLKMLRMNWVTLLYVLIWENVCK